MTGSVAATTPTLRLGGRPLPVVGRARVYVCGVTPYDVTHLGHAATFVWADVAARVLRLTGAEVEVCRNVTDVDDVLSAEAGRLGQPYDELAAVQQFHFEHDMAALGVRRPDHAPRAHSFVPQVIRLAQALVDAGAAYAARGSVFFPGAAVAEAAGLGRDEAVRRLAAYGDDPHEDAKRDPLDVAVWQASSGDQPAWPSPWGPGRPGWHAECTAMALTVLGPALDLHAGGADLAFPHHAYESAQAEAVTGVRPFARSWLRAGTVRVGGAKMAKSAGNLVLVSALLAEHRAAAVRLLLLDRRWHEDWDWHPAALDAAEQRLDDLHAAAGRTDGSAAAASGAALDAVRAALCDDLDVSRALDVAVDEGGAAARLAVATLALS